MRALRLQDQLQELAEHAQGPDPRQEPDQEAHVRALRKVLLYKGLELLILWVFNYKQFVLFVKDG